MHRIKATLRIGLVAAGVAASVAVSTPAGASKSHASSPKTIVVGVKGRTMAAGGLRSRRSFPTSQPLPVRLRPTVLSAWRTSPSPRQRTQRPS